MSETRIASNPRLTYVNAADASAAPSPPPNVDDGRSTDAEIQYLPAED